MKYIESKLNPDGTYDHSEVIEAHKKGAYVERFYNSACIWSYTNSPGFSMYANYRAVIEEKPSQDQIVDEIIDAILYEEKLSILIRDKFQSGNAIPVERITLTRAEVNEVFPGLLK